MTTQQIADKEILYEQGYVINELLRVNESLWDRISNTEECDEVTPYLAELLKENGEVIFADYDCYWWGRTITGQALYIDRVIQEIARQTER